MIPRTLAARLLLLPVTFLGVTLATFALVHLAPGDPASVRAGLGATPELIAENRALAGLDKPIAARYVAWLQRSVRLDFGESLVDGRPVRTRILEALPRTAAIAGLALVLAFAVAVPVGAWSAARDGTRGARALEAGLAVAYGFPVVALALLLLRAGAPWGDSLFAPAVCLALPSAIVLSRQQRSAFIAALAADWIRTARAKGAGPGRVIVGHALRAAMLPTVTIAGAEVPVLLSGAVLVERAFGVPGLGELGYDAALARDYPTLMGLATLSAISAAAAVLLSDLAIAWLDPRLRREP